MVREIEALQLDEPSPHLVALPEPKEIVDVDTWEPVQEEIPHARYPELDDMQVPSVARAIDSTCVTAEPIAR